MNVEWTEIWWLNSIKAGRMPKVLAMQNIKTQIPEKAETTHTYGANRLLWSDSWIFYLDRYYSWECEQKTIYDVKEIEMMMEEKRV